MNLDLLYISRSFETLEHVSIIFIFHFKEAPTDNVANSKIILGHRFVKEGKAPGNYFCDSCGSTIWALVHTLHKCIGKYFFPSILTLALTGQCLLKRGFVTICLYGKDISISIKPWPKKKALFAKRL